MGWRLELTDVPWMTVKADMGSDGAIWGHMGPYWVGEAIKGLRRWEKSTRGHVGWRLEVTDV